MTASELNYFQEAGLVFEKLLRLSSFPLAIKLIKDRSEIPPNCKTPQKDLNTKNFLCQNFKVSRSYGWTMAVMKEDCICKVARMVYKWDDYTKEIEEWAHQFNVGLYSKDLETSRKLKKELHFLKEKYEGLIISPLTRTKIVPDIMQIYCLPAQAMRLIQAYLYMEGGVMTFTAAGRIGSCHDGVIKPFLINKPQLVILGNGDRVWGGAEDAEILFSLPTSCLSLILEGLEKTHQAGLRYPIPKYMNYAPGFQNNFKKQAQDRAKGTLIKDDLK
ncbi:MAG: DUF169 domain-containing protein [Promethearchaeota archaeon]